MAAMTPENALKDFLDDNNLRVVAQPIIETLKHSSANIDQLASIIDSLTQNKDDYHNFYLAYFQAVRYTGSEVPNATLLVNLLNALSKNGSPPLIGMYIEEYGLGTLTRSLLHFCL